VFEHLSKIAALLFGRPLIYRFGPHSLDDLPHLIGDDIDHVGVEDEAVKQLQIGS
jgi:hypothetical protein